MSDRHTRGLAHGGAAEIDTTRAAQLGAEWSRTTLERAGVQEPRQVDAARSDYSAGYNATTLAPSNPLDGVALPFGRVWAEARSITHSGGSGSVGVSLMATQNGVRCTVTAPPGQTITGGSVRFWSFDPAQQQWSLGGVDESLATGARSVATTDQFVTVGAQ